jgi:predicted DCC family thiol-disulfide oxidoreductase YuxK
MSSNDQIKIFYDGECPFCKRYVRYLKLKESIGVPELHDLRQDVQSREEFERKGYDVDKGMVVTIGDRVYHGKDAVNILATLSTSSTRLNQLNKIVLSSPLMAAILYPILVFCRNLTLEILGQRFIKDEEGGREDPAFDFFKVFAWSYGVYSIFHFSYLTYYSETIAPIPGPLSVIFLVLAIGVVLRPWAVRMFSLLVVVRMFEMWQQMPMTSNHAIIDFFLLVTLSLTGLACLIQRSSWNDYVRLFAPAGRWFLIIMYVFGIFHKINTDFMNPESSCAVSLWQQYPFPAFISDGLWAHYLAIYGTFIIEGLIMFGLVFKKTRYAAVVAGMGFHLFLGLSSNAYYGPFSIFSFTLHTLFLPQNFWATIKTSRYYKIYEARPKIALLLMFNWAVLLCLAAVLHNHTALTLLFCLVAVPLLALVIMYAKEYKDAPTGWMLLKTGPIATLMVLLYFFNNSAPYIGLKTHQSLNMFSNLHIDATRTNHLVITQPPTMSPFLKDIVQIKGIYSPLAPDTNMYTSKLDTVYHDLLATVQELHDSGEAGEVTYSFVRHGQYHENWTYDDFKKDIDLLLLPEHVRKIIHFEGLDPRQPRPCTAFK